LHNKVVVDMKETSDQQTITNDKVVVFSYVLSDSSGNELERSTDDQPTAYLHGHFNILYSLEAELEGHRIGDKLLVELPAGKAYGLREENTVLRVSNKKLQIIGLDAKKRFDTVGKGKSLTIKKGMIVQYQSEQGATEGTVVKAGKFNSEIDTNHPMAGMDLQFDIIIRDVRDASSEELAHGHAHGLGGHHH